MFEIKVCVTAGKAVSTLSAQADAGVSQERLHWATVVNSVMIMVYAVNSK